MDSIKFGIVEPKFENRAKKRIFVSSFFVFGLIIIAPQNLTFIKDYFLIYLSLITFSWVLFVIYFLDRFEIIDSLIINPSQRVIKSNSFEIKIDKIKFVNLYPSNVSAMFIFPTSDYYLCEILLSNFDKVNIYVTNNRLIDGGSHRVRFWNKKISLPEAFKLIKIRYKIAKPKV